MTILINGGFHVASPAWTLLPNDTTLARCSNLNNDPELPIVSKTKFKSLYLANKSLHNTVQGYFPAILCVAHKLKYFLFLTNTLNFPATLFAQVTSFSWNTLPLLSLSDSYSVTKVQLKNLLCLQFSYLYTCLLSLL